MARTRDAPRVAPVKSTPERVPRALTLSTKGTPDTSAMARKSVRDVNCRLRQRSLRSGVSDMYRTSTPSRPEPSCRLPWTELVLVLNQVSDGAVEAVATCVPHLGGSSQGRRAASDTCGSGRLSPSTSCAVAAPSRACDVEGAARAGLAARACDVCRRARCARGGARALWISHGPLLCAAGSCASGRGSGRPTCVGAWHAGFEHPCRACHQPRVGARGEGVW